jgi:hypothetical protein
MKIDLSLGVTRTWSRSFAASVVVLLIEHFLFVPVLITRSYEWGPPRLQLLLLCSAARATSPRKTPRWFFEKRRSDTVHVIRIVADGTLDRVSGSAEPNAALAGFNSAGQFFHTTSFEANVLPSFVQGFLDSVRNIDNLRSRDDVVPAVNEAIKDLVEPETVLRFAILVQIIDLGAMQNLTSPSERGDGTNVGMHRGVDKTRVVVVALHIPWSIEPIYPHGFNAGFGVSVDVLPLHDAAYIVRLAGRFTHEVDLI